MAFSCTKNFVACVLVTKRHSAHLRLRNNRKPFDMTTDTSVLFEPFTLKNLTIPNRIVMAPMTRNFATGGVPGQDVADYYRRRAEGQVGLIVTEGTVVNRPEAANEPNIPHFHGNAALAGWQNVVDEVHKVGGKIAPQIWHTGTVRAQFPDRPRKGPSEGPSGLFKANEPEGQAMTEEDVADTIAAFATAAGDAVRMGFDTVELHGAHGYLIDQFFWNQTNVRTDQWGGGTLAERSHFAVELVKAVRAAMGPDTPLILRVSQWKQQEYTFRAAPSPDELTAWLAPLVDAGVDILHCSQRRFLGTGIPRTRRRKGIELCRLGQEIDWCSDNFGGFGRPQPGFLHWLYTKQRCGGGPVQSD